MAGFNAGEVYVLLGGRLDRSAFSQFDTSMKTSAAKASAFEKALGASSARSSAALHKMGRAAKYGAGAGVLALGSALVYSVKKAADFESQLSALGAVSKASGRQMVLLKKQAMDAGAATKFSALEAAQAQTELAKGGLSVATILKGGLSSALALAAAGELELADAAATTVNAMKQFGIDGSKAGHIADALATAANNTTTDVGELAMALNQGGGVAAMAGASFDDTVASLSALADASVRGSDAGTSLKSFFLNIATPSVQAREAMDALGMSIFTASGDLKSLPGIAQNLQQSFGDLTKEEFLNRAGIIAGSDAARALFAIYKAGPEGMRGYIRAQQEVGTAADIAAKKQDNLKGRLENLKGSLETAAITVGQELLPVLTEAAEDLTEFINAAARSGDLENFGEGVADAARDIIGALPQVANAIRDVGETAGDVAGAVMDLAGALDSITPGGLGALVAGFALFKTAQFVAPGLVALAAGIGKVSMAARTAPSLAAFAGDLIGPAGLAKLAVVGLGVAIYALSTKESSETEIANAFTRAKEAQAAATREAQDAIYAAADAGVAVKQATIDNAAAEAELTRLRKEGKQGTDEWAQAQLSAEQTSLRLQGARKANTDSIDAEIKAQQGAVDIARKARDEMAAIQKLHEEGTGSVFTGGDEKAAALAQARLNELNKVYIQTLANQDVAEVSRQRLMERSTVITAENAEGISDLIDVMGDVPAEKQGKLLVDNQDALAKAGELASQLNDLGRTGTVTKVLANTDSAKSAVLAFEAVLRGVPERIVTKILADANSAEAETRAFEALLAGVPELTVAQILAKERGKAEVDALVAAIARVQSKSVTITTYNRSVNLSPGSDAAQNASGRSSGSAGPSWVGEGTDPREYVIDRRTGAGFITSGPAIANLGADDYVIPTDQRFRGRALGLFASLARDIGIPGFAKGRKPRKRFTEGGVPFEDVQARRDQLDAAYDQAQKDKRQAENDAAKKGADNKATRQAGKKRLPGLEAKLAALKPKRDQARKEFAGARKTNTTVLDLQSAINVLGDQMDLADRQGKTGLFTKLKGQRVGKLEALRTQLKQALRSPARGESKRSIQEQLAALGIELYDAKHAAATKPEAAELSPYTKAEQKLIDEYNAGLAVAEALTPDDTADDKSWLEKLLGVQGAALGRAMAPGTPSKVLEEAANAVAATQDRLRGLTSQGSGSADLQAQLDQANERARVATIERDVNAAFITASGGSGSGGSGTVVNQTVNTLHPSDPGTLRAIGDAAGRGFSLRGSGGNNRRLRPGF